MEKETLLICFDESEESRAEELRIGLKGLGYTALLANRPVNENDFVLLLLGPDCSKEGLLKSNPWLGKQFEDSSFRGFRLMPVVAYHGNSEDVDAVWESSVGEIYEEMISGEFKPFGFDLDNENAAKEFHRVYEEYSE